MLKKISSFIFLLVLVCSSDAMAAENAKDFYRAGKKLNADKRYDAAILQLNQAVELDPKLCLAWNERGSAYLNKSNYKEAIQDYTKAIEVCRSTPDVFYPLHNRGIAEKNLKNLSAALTDFTAAIQINPQEPEAYMARGKVFELEGDADKAIHDYSRAIELFSPKDAPALVYALRGRLYAKSTQYIKAITDLSKAISLYKDNPAELYLERGMAYAATKQADKALSDLDQAITLSPKYTGAYINRGMCYSQLKNNPEKAIEDYTKAIDLSPNFFLAYYNRGNVYSDQENLTAALEDFNRALDLIEKTGENLEYKHQVLTGRCYAYYSIGSLDRAIQDCSAAIKLNPSYAEAYEIRARTYKKKLMFKEAMADHIRAVEIDPSYTNDSAYPIKKFLFQTLFGHNEGKASEE